MQKTFGKLRLFDKGVHSLIWEQLKSSPVARMIGVSALILFGCSSLRHALIQSSGFDLGIYDQVVYLISQGQEPLSSFLNMHHLGNHAAWAVYALGLLYKIYPTVYWLLAVQALALALGALPVWRLAIQAGLKEGQAVAMAAVYLLYPLVFNVNLFDFHPEVMGVPVLLAAILAARLDRPVWFTLGILFVLGCKDALSLTVAATGFWLLVFEKRRLCGAIALLAGIASFIIVTKGIIPHFSGSEAAAVWRYKYLGNSVLEIAQNMIFKPGQVLPMIFSLANLKYLCLVFLPVIWGLSPKHLTPLVGAIPALTLNILADYEPQKSLVFQYSLPVVPFLMLAVISTLAAGEGWLRDRRAIVLWSLIFFLGLARWSYFFTKYLPTLDTWQATREAIALVKTKGGVLTTNQIAPHLSHRPFIKLAHDYSQSDLAQIEYVLLNTRHTDVNLAQEEAASFAEQLKKAPDFQLAYQRDDVYLFTKKP